mmetsp:Transcript_42222/g.140376  ORF Transcript_42222/g.140376 Transcript_42222/m.140376 type:complete len:250 (+) Transcript_42222:241-990(+)
MSRRISTTQNASTNSRRWRLGGSSTSRSTSASYAPSSWRSLSRWPCRARASSCAASSTAAWTTANHRCGGCSRSATRVTSRQRAWRCESSTRLRCSSPLSSRWPCSRILRSGPPSGAGGAAQRSRCGCSWSCASFASRASSPPSTSSPPPACSSGFDGGCGACCARRAPTSRRSSGGGAASESCCPRPPSRAAATSSSATLGDTRRTWPAASPTVSRLCSAAASASSTWTTCATSPSSSPPSTGQTSCS